MYLLCSECSEIIWITAPWLSIWTSVELKMGQWNFKILGGKVLIQLNSNLIGVLIGGFSEIIRFSTPWSNIWPPPVGGDQLLAHQEVKYYVTGLKYINEHPPNKHICKFWSQLNHFFSDNPRKSSFRRTGERTLTNATFPSDFVGGDNNHSTSVVQTRCLIS